MINWDYNANDYKANNANLLDEGKYRARVINAVETVAKNGTQGIEILLEVNGSGGNRLRYYIWYNRDYQARTNQLLGEFFNSFDVLPGEHRACEHWIGKRGAVYVMHDVYKVVRLPRSRSVCLAISRGLCPLGMILLPRESVWMLGHSLPTNP